MEVALAVKKAGPPRNLLELPEHMIEQVLEYLPYDEISKNRIVSRKFNQICQGLLNMGFNRMTKRHAHYLKIIKSQLPRRESERRNHPLARHADILTCIETRLSMLSMTYSKYIEVDMCCFIPGKVIDEVLHVLNLISSIDTTVNNQRPNERPLRTHEVLQELRDISSMAIDHFDEKIAPDLKKVYCDISTRSFICSPPSMPFHSSYGESSSSLLPTPDILKQWHSTPDVGGHRTYGDPLVDTLQTNYNRMERKYKVAIRKLNSVIGSHNRQIHRLRSFSMQVNDLNSQVIELRRRLEECTKTAPAATEERAAPRPAIERPRAAAMILKRIAEPLATETSNKRAKTDE